MGLLDEAIRQHLELKRAHGASDEELHMQEQEALGPVRREPVAPAPEEVEPAPEPPLAPDLEPAPEPALAHDEELVYEDDPVSEDEEAALYEEAPTEHLGEARIEGAPEEFYEPVEPYEEPARDEHFTPEPAGDTPTRGFEAVEEPLAPADLGSDEGEEEDVLEETPEFLQETPEHDRL